MISGVVGIDDTLLAQSAGAEFASHRCSRRDQELLALRLELMLDARLCSPGSIVVSQSAGSSMDGPRPIRGHKKLINRKLCWEHGWARDGLPDSAFYAAEGGAVRDCLRISNKIAARAILAETYNYIATRAAIKDTWIADQKKFSKDTRSHSILWTVPGANNLWESPKTRGWVRVIHGLGGEIQHIKVKNWSITRDRSSWSYLFDTIEKASWSRPHDFDLLWQDQIMTTESLCFIVLRVV